MLPGSICRENIPAPFSWQEVSPFFSVETCARLCKSRDPEATPCHRDPEVKGRPKKSRAHEPFGSCALFRLSRKVFYASRLNLSREYSGPVFLARGLALFFCGNLFNPVQNSRGLSGVMPSVGRNQHVVEIIDDRPTRFVLYALPKRDLAIVQFRVNRDQHAELIVDARLGEAQTQNDRAVRSRFERSVRFVGRELRSIQYSLKNQSSLWLPSKSISCVMCFSTAALKSSVVRLYRDRR